MSRASRLLDLIQSLRRRRGPVSGAVLAQELGVSLRTLYRDIATLVAQGAHIEGEAGVGYVLRPGFLLPPLMFSDEEIDALVVGARWVSERGDPSLAKAGGDALAKILAVLPEDLGNRAQDPGLLIGPVTWSAMSGIDVAVIRAAMRAERKLFLHYEDAKGGRTGRTVWPVALGFFDRLQVLVAWCELRQGFRHFRTDRIAGLQPTELRYPRRRRALLKEWRDSEDISADKN